MASAAYLRDRPLEELWGGWGIFEPHEFFSRNICDPHTKTFVRNERTGKRTHGKHKDEKRIAKPFETYNGQTDARMKIFLHGCSQTDARLTKMFERMQAYGNTTVENFCTDAVERMN